MRPNNTKHIWGQLAGGVCAIAVLLAPALQLQTVYANEQTAPDSSSTVSAADVGEALSSDGAVLDQSDAVTTKTDSDSALVAATDSATVDVPKDPSDGVTFGSNNGPSIDISLPNADAAADAQKVATGVVAYAANDGSANAVQATEDGGVRMLTVIDNATAPTSYDYQIAVPNGGHIEIKPEGIALIIGSDGNPIAAAKTPWAKDANGQDVPTYFTSDGLTLTQHVEHNVPGIAYPVTADPWFGIKLIDHVTWSGATLQVYPTTWARYWAGFEARGTAWNDVVHLAPGANKGTMMNQFYCHWDFVRLRAPNKPSWNLDSWRPDVGYWTTVLRNCNP